MAEPFVLQYGKFPGWTVERLMFEPNGYEYLDYQANRTVVGVPNALVNMARRIVDKGEAPNITARCQCKAKATHVFVRRGNDGVGFGEFCCANCAKNPPNGYEAIELKFSAILRFHGTTDRHCFIRELKQACGFGGSERITAEKAHKFFFPEPKPKRDKDGPLLPFVL